MHYYIDGYNYIFRHLNKKKNLQFQRQELIYDLNQKAAALNLSIIVVFDAHHQMGDESISHYKHLEIVFTAEKESADDYILRKLCEVIQPKQYTLVTSDNDLSRKARCQRVNTQTIDEFVDWIENKYYSRKQKTQSKKSPLSQTPRLNINSETSTEVSNPESMLAYYEKIFLENYTQAYPEQTQQKKTKGVDITEKSEIDFDRWLRIFEKKTREED